MTTFVQLQYQEEVRKLVQPAVGEEQELVESPMALQLSVNNWLCGKNMSGNDLPRALLKLRLERVVAKD